MLIHSIMLVHGFLFEFSTWSINDPLFVMPGDSPEGCYLPSNINCYSLQDKWEQRECCPVSEQGSRYTAIYSWDGPLTEVGESTSWSSFEVLNYRFMAYSASNFFRGICCSSSNIFLASFMPKKRSRFHSVIITMLFQVINSSF